MMRKVLFAAASAVFCCAALSAAAQSPSPDLLQKFCIETDAQAAPALAKADAEGWMAISKDAAPIPASMGFALEDYAVRVKAGNDTLQVLVIGRGAMTSIPSRPPADFCMVMNKPADAASVERTKAWAGVDPLATQAAQAASVYAFVDTPGGGHKKLLGGDADAQADLKTGKVRMLIVMTPPNKDMSILGYVKLHAAEAAALNATK